MSGNLFASNYQSFSNPKRFPDEKDLTIQELRETVLIMSEKIKKLEQLLRIKDSKIESLRGLLGAGGAGGGTTEQWHGL